MLLNISYNDKEITRQINEAVGRPFGLAQRWKLKGIGSPKLFIDDCSQDIQTLLDLDKYINTCNIELRPRGVIIRFRALLETWGLVIPFHKLTIYKNQGRTYSIHRDASFIHVHSKQASVHPFFSKVIEHKAEYHHGLQPE